VFTGNVIPDLLPTVPSDKIKSTQMSKTSTHYATR